MPAKQGGFLEDNRSFSAYRSTLTYYVVFSRGHCEALNRDQRPGMVVEFLRTTDNGHGKVSDHLAWRHYFSA